MKTPKQLQEAEKTQAAAVFCQRMLVELRKRLFADVSEKEWFQHERIVRQAILEPSLYIQSRGASLPAEKYRAILMTVVIGIEQHADRSKIRRMGYYFLKSVQDHMRFKGDGYYEEAKNGEIRTAAGPLGKVLRSIPQIAKDRSITEALAASAEVLRSKGGRKKKQPARGIQKELF